MHPCHPAPLYIFIYSINLFSLPVHTLHSRLWITQINQYRYNSSVTSSSDMSSNHKLVQWFEISINQHINRQILL